MLRRCRPLFCSVVCVAGAWLGVAVIGGAQDAEKKMPPVAKEVAAPIMTNQTVLKLLDRTVETKWFDTPALTLKDFIALLDEAHRKKFGIEVPVLVDYEAFKEESPDTYKEEADLYDVKIKIPQTPQRLSMRSILGIAVSKIPTNNATWIVRNGLIEITTATRAAPAALMQTPVRTVFNDRRFSEAIQELSAQTGATILVSPRIGSKLNDTVSATFANGIPLKTAVGILADMTGLKMIELEGALYVTTPENAEALRKERKAQQEEELWRGSNGIREANPPVQRPEASAAAA